MIIPMNVAGVTPSPSILVRLIQSPDALVSHKAAVFLIGQLQAPDPMVRWGAVTCLLHTPVRQYMDRLLNVLQDQGQTDEVKALVSRSFLIKLPAQPISRSMMVRVYARWRLMLYLIAGLHTG